MPCRWTAVSWIEGRRKTNERIAMSSARTPRPRRADIAPATHCARRFPPLNFSMSAADKQVIQVEVKAVLPTSGGCAVFLGNADKVFVIYIDHSVGLAISMAMRREPRERPQTHDLIASILAGFGGRIERVIINDFKAGVYYARLVIVAENELYERKIVEIDARPSDCIALAVGAKAPLYVTRPVWDDAEDMSDLLQRMEERGTPFQQDPGPPPEPGA